MLDVDKQFLDYLYDIAMGSNTIKISSETLVDILMHIYFAKLNCTPKDVERKNRRTYIRGKREGFDESIAFILKGLKGDKYEQKTR